MLAKPLQKGDTIGIVAPSNRLLEKHKIYLNNFIAKLEELGFNIVLSSDIYGKDNLGVSSSSPKNRADELNRMFANKNIKLIWCYQGGNTVNQVFDYLDFELIKNNPKIIVGKSDNDVLLLALNKKTNLITFHGCDAKLWDDKEFDFKYTQKYFIERFFNKNLLIENSNFGNRKCLREWIIEGKLLGCNLSSIIKLAGTEYFPDFQDSILFLEGYMPDIRKLVAGITQLKMMGVLDRIKGIVVGHIYKFDSRGEKNVNYEDVVLDLVKEYDFPVLKVNEFGHYQPHAFLPIGAKIKLDAKNKEIKIISDFLS